MPLQILLNGAKGRMGQTIAGVAGEMDAAIRAATDAGDNPAAHLAGCDVIIDFSAHSGTGRLLELAVAQKKLLALAAQVPCVWAGNFSVGVNLLFALTRRASAVLGSDYDAEVVEMHHRFKKDAPSGTAARLLEIILEERKLTAEALRHGRSGITGERQPTEVGVHALRGGDAVRAAHWVVKQKPGVYDMQDVLGLK
jgi:4-hydroxy-tetrahydrodipicolinate reductase